MKNQNKDIMFAIINYKNIKTLNYKIINCNNKDDMRFIDK